MIQESVDDVFDVQNPSIIFNQVNALGFGSIGLMLKVRNRYPDLFKQYHELCGWFKSYQLQEEIIGSFQALPIPETSNILCNAFTQRFYTDTRYAVDMDAWDRVLSKIQMQITNYHKKTNILYEIHSPSKLGIGMKPDEIEQIKDMISSMFNDSPILWVYHL